MHHSKAEYLGHLRPPNPAQWKLTYTIRDPKGYDNRPYTKEACVQYWLRYIESAPFYNEGKTYYAVLRLFERGRRIRGHCVVEAEPEQNLAGVTQALNPNEIFQQAILEACDEVIIIHNEVEYDHPSPSHMDLDETIQFAQAARMFRIMAADHIIVGRKELYSFRSNGILPLPT